MRLEKVPHRCPHTLKTQGQETRVLVLDLEGGDTLGWGK